jgi:YVTN family beta-propeller protein
MQSSGLLVCGMSREVCPCAPQVRRFARPRLRHRRRDTATNQVMATIPRKMDLVAITPDGNRAYVTDNTDGNFNLAVIDTGANTVVTTVPLSESEFTVAVATSPDGKYVYATSLSTIWVVDTGTNMVVARIPARDGFDAGALAFTPDGKFAYVVSQRNPAVLVLDTITKTVGPTVTLPGFANRIAADGKHAYATGDKMIFVIDTATNAVAATVPVEGRPFGIAIIPLPPITR